MTKKLYPCTRCAGKGIITAFLGVWGGVCFKCEGRGTQENKPAPKGEKWAVLDSNSVHTYNIVAVNPNKAIEKAMKTYARACAEFKAEHDMANAVAVPYAEYWTPERVEAVRAL